MVEEQAIPEALLREADKLMLHSLGKRFETNVHALAAALLAAELRGREQQKEADARKAEERAAYLRRNEMYPAFGLNSQAAALDDIAASIRL